MPESSHSGTSGSHADRIKRPWAVRIDPDKFISRPYTECPNCQQEALGILMICSHHYVRRCKHCRYDASFELPRLSKKVLYLDQFVISEMMKSLNPHVSAERRRRLRPEWREIFEKIDELNKLQLLVCPSSSFHRCESSVAADPDALCYMYEYLSHDVAFRSADDIKLEQLYVHAQNWISGNQLTPIQIDRSLALDGDVNGWQDCLLIPIPIEQDPDRAKERREERTATEEGLRQDFKVWQGLGIDQKGSGITFLDQYAAERDRFGTYILEQDFHEFDRFARAMNGDEPLTEDFLFPSFVYRALHMLREVFNGSLGDSGNVPRALHEYLTTAQFDGVHFIRISALLLAALARRASSGRKAPPNRGTKNDLNMVSVLMPYCDAIFLDKELHSMLSEWDVKSRLGVATRVFSMANIDEFFAYLHEIRDEASAKHVQLVESVYGTSWTQPYTTLYETRTRSQMRRRGEPTPPKAQ